MGEQTQQSQMADRHHSHIEDLQAPPVHGQPTEDRSAPRPGRPLMESYSTTDTRPVVDDSHYRERCSRLEGDLHDSDRKIRLQVDEIMQLKRDLSKDRTETLLTHQNELSDVKDAHRTEVERLKENHRRDVREFERQIADMERQAFKLELEQRSGDRTTGNRILDMLEDVAPTLFENLTGLISGAMAGQGQPGLPQQAPQLTGEDADRLRQAFDQDLRDTASGVREVPNPMTQQPPNSGEGEESPHRLSAAGDDEHETVGLNDFFATHANGHHEQYPMDT
jgi:hypothetical protein